MNEQRRKILDGFLKNTDKLYDNINSWIGTHGLTALPEKIEVTEEASGKYSANKLTIQDEKKQIIASIVPIGAWVIGANGRVDLIGKFDKLIIVNLEKGGLSLSTTMTVGDHQETSTRHFYKGIKEAGWYWIEDTRLGKARLLDKDLFLELLSEVSDYEF